MGTMDQQTNFFVDEESLGSIQTATDEHRSKVDISAETYHQRSCVTSTPLGEMATKTYPCLPGI